MKQFGTNVAKVSSLLGIFLVWWILKVYRYIHIFDVCVYLYLKYMFFKIFAKQKKFLCMLQMSPWLISSFKTYDVIPYPTVHYHFHSNETAVGGGGRGRLRWWKCMESSIFLNIMQISSAYNKQQRKCCLLEEASYSAFGMCPFFWQFFYLALSFLPPLPRPK